MSEACLCGTGWWEAARSRRAACSTRRKPPTSRVTGTWRHGAAGEGGRRDRAACGDCSWCHATRQPVEILVCSTIVNSFRLRLHLLSLLISVAIQVYFPGPKPWRSEARELGCWRKHVLTKLLGVSRLAAYSPALCCSGQQQGGVTGILLIFWQGSASSNLINKSIVSNRNNCKDVVCG